VSDICALALPGRHRAASVLVFTQPEQATSCVKSEGAFRVSALYAPLCCLSRITPAPFSSLGPAAATDQRIPRLLGAASFLANALIEEAEVIASSCDEGRKQVARQ
jgi:hypothetical protein